MFILLCMQSYETAITLISRVMWNFDENITWRIVPHVSNALKMITSVCTMQSKNMPVRLVISSLKIVFPNLVDDAYNKTVWRTGYIFGIHLRVATLNVLVCRPFDLLTSQSVDVSVCRRFGLSTFRVIAVSVYRRFGLVISSASNTYLLMRESKRERARARARERKWDTRQNSQQLISSSIQLTKIYL